MLTEEAERVRPPPPAVSPPVEAVLVSAVRNEAPFLLEWIAYHKLIGFPRIVILSNTSDDGTEEILAALAEAGEIVHHHVDPLPRHSPQFSAGKAFRELEGYRDGTWYLWLDADEFLNIHVGDRRLPDLLAALGDAQGIFLNWRLFGTSGHSRFPGRYVSTDFSGASALDFGPNRETKSLFRKGKAIAGFDDMPPYRPRLARRHGLTEQDFLAGTAQPLAEGTTITTSWLGGKTGIRTNVALPSETGWALAQINHYSVRTPEFFALKARRGRGAARSKRQHNTRHTPEYFTRHDRNEETDLSIAVWEAPTTAEIGRLRALPGVEAALKRSAALVAQALAGAQMPAPGERARVVRSDGARPRTVLFSAMKNEAPFLLKWVAYHKAIGFDEIVICSNPSNDGTEELLAALAAEGEIRHLSTVASDRKSAQHVASVAFSRHVGFVEGDWYLWLDADEFLNVHVGNRTVNALLEALGDKRCFLINWRVFGSSGNLRFPGRFIASDFTGASEATLDANLQVKALFRFGRELRGFARYGIHRPLVRRNSAFALKDVVTGNGQPPLASFRMNRRWLEGVDSGGTHSSARPEFGWSLAQINHYIVRTPEFFALKRLRGRGYASNSEGKANSRHTPEFFDEHDRNEAEDRSILHWQDAVTAGIDRLLRAPAIARAAAEATERTEKIMAELRSDPAEAAQTPPEAPPAAPVFQLTFPAKERDYVTAAYAKAQNVLEYGSGGSTVLAARGGSRVVSVESDKAWAEKLAGVLAGISDKAHVHHVEIGPTAAWGFPKTPTKYGQFPNYALSVWDRPDLGEPDLVLIDGRFRAACLAAVLLRAKRPTTVLFDDYAERKYYHAVEKLARKEEVVGRMACFTVTPGPIPPEMLTQVIGWFSDPR